MNDVKIILFFLIIANEITKCKVIESEDSYIFEIKWYTDQAI